MRRRMPRSFSVSRAPRALARSVGVGAVSAALVLMRAPAANAAEPRGGHDGAKSRTSASRGAESNDRARALARYREAYAAMNAGDWTKARRLLLELWETSKTYDVAASLGQVEYQLLNFVDAARYMAFAIENMAPKERFSSLERYRKALDEIRAWVGTVQVTVPTPGAEIRVDGEVVGQSPFDEEIFVTPGTHVLEAFAGQRRLAKATVSIAAGERLTQSLDLGWPAHGASSDGERDSKRGASAADGARARSLVPAYVGGAVTALGAGMAIGFGLAASAAEDEADALRTRIGPSGCRTGTARRADCDAASDAVDRQRRAATLATVGAGLGAVSAIATLGYLLWPSAERRHSNAATLRPAVAVDPGFGQVLVSGAF